MPLFIMMGEPGASGQTHVNARVFSQTAIQKVCLAGTESTLYRKSVKGIEGMPGESAEWNIRIRDAVREAIIARSSEVVGDYSGQLPADEKLREAVVEVRQRFAAIWPQVRRKPGDVAKGRYTVGDEIALLPCSASADAIVFVQAQGVLLTRANKIVGFAGGGLFGGLRLLASRSDLWLTLIDAKSGEIIAIAHLRPSAGDKFINSPAEAYRARLDHSFNTMRLGKEK